MLISFIGSPASGKTTTAALVFAKLKEYGLTSEFLVEQARIYITEKRLANPDKQLVLTDDDQLKILANQIKLENLFHSACPSTTYIITDSSAINTLMYLTPTTQQVVAEVVKQAASKYKLVFYCQPITQLVKIIDENRVHTEEESQILDSHLKTLLNNFKDLNVTTLFGNPHERAAKAITKILESQYVNTI